MNVVLFSTFITCSLFSIVLGANATSTKCEAKDNKGFAKAKCGTKPNNRCCHPKREACVTAMPWVASGTAKETSVCSENRALFGMKLVKVIMIPVMCGILVAILLAQMGKKLKSIKSDGVKPPPVAVLCQVQVLLGFLVMLTELWKFGVYDAFLSVIVFHAALNYKTLPNWAFGIVILLQLGNLVAILGPVKGVTDGVFLPLGMLAADGSTVSFGKKGVVDHLVVSSCSAYFDNYFKLESIELNVKGHDPKVTHFGLCTDEFIATVVTVIIVKMVMWVIMTVLNTQMLAFKFIGKEEPYTNQIVVSPADSQKGA